MLGVREVGEGDGRPFIAAERFPRRSLDDVLRDGPLDPGTALALLKQVADALDAAHAAGLVHRTLSAESVLLEGDLRRSSTCSGCSRPSGRPSGAT